MRKKLLVRLLVVLAVFYLLGVLVWAPIHEFLHWATAEILGFHAVIAGIFPVAKIRVVNPVYANQFQPFLIFVAPYILDLSAVLVYYLHRRKLWNWASYLGMTDLYANITEMFVKIIFHVKQPDDFFELIFHSNIGFIALLIITFATLIWIRSSWADARAFLWSAFGTSKKKSKK